MPVASRALEALKRLPSYVQPEDLSQVQPPTVGDLEARTGALQREAIERGLQQQIRQADPMAALYDSAQALSYQTGLMSSPTYAERMRLEAKYAEPGRAHELARLRAQYGEPREYMASVEALKQQGQLERERARGEWERQVAGMRAQLGFLGQLLAAQARERAAQASAAGRIAGGATSVSPSTLPEASQWFEQFLGLGGGAGQTGTAIPYSELEQFAREQGLPISDVVTQVYLDGGQVDFNR
jgi:hypothetical protein